MCLKFKDNYCVYTSHYQLPTKPIALDSLFLNLPSHCARSSCIASPQKRPPAPSQACFYCPIILQSLLLRIRAWSRIILPLQLLRTVVKFSLSPNFTKLSTLSTFQNFSCPLPCQFWYLDYLLKPPPRVSLRKLAHSNSSESGPSCFETLHHLLHTLTRQPQQLPSALSSSSINRPIIFAATPHHRGIMWESAQCPHQRRGLFILKLFSESTPPFTLIRQCSNSQWLICLDSLWLTLGLATAAQEGLAAARTRSWGCFGTSL